MKILINANYQGTERQEIDGVLARQTKTTVWVRIRDFVAEEFERAKYDYFVEWSADKQPDVVVDPFEERELFRVIKRKIKRDIPALVEGSPHLTSGSAV